MELSLAVTILTIYAIESAQVRNSERMTISLENFDDLEMIPESFNHAVIGKKLEKFHDYVKKSNVAKHPWEKLLIKEAEYKKSERAYQKSVHEAVIHVKEVTGHRLKLRRTIKPQFIDKRQLSDMVSLEDGDDDDEEGVAKPTQQTNSNVLKNDYQKQIVEDEANKKAFKYSDKGKPEENINEAFQKIIDFKTPENCSNITGFGVKAVECLIRNYQTNEMTGKEAFVRFMKIFLIWVDIYLGVAIPLWCIKGWGCGCIPWKYCHPRSLVKEVQRYIAENPPGVYINEDGEEEHYAPTLREKELYDKINRKILSM